jgi:hypothetical protein
MNTDESFTPSSSTEMKQINMKDLKTSFIGKTSEYINTILDDSVLLRVAIRL